MVETLTCPKCKVQIRTDKTVGLPSEKKVNCPKCKQPFALGDGRVQVVHAPPPVPKVVPPPQRDEIIPATVIKQVPAAIAVPAVVDPPQVPSMSRFCGDGQSTAMVEKLLNRIKEVCTSTEEPLYMAVQQKPVANISPDAVVLTNKRVMIFRQKMLGRMEFQDCAWLNVANVHMKENLLGATIFIQSTAGGTVEVDHIPKKQARQVYRVAQEMEEKMVEERRNRAMEEDRNRAGQVVVQTAVAPPQPIAAQASDDPMESLAKLKRMADAGLITEAEFAAKKSEILSRM